MSKTNTCNMVLMLITSARTVYEFCYSKECMFASQVISYPLKTQQNFQKNILCRSTYDLGQ